MVVLGPFELHSRAQWQFLHSVLHSGRRGTQMPEESRIVAGQLELPSMMVFGRVGTRVHPCV